ncbi:uncharacterized protein B0H18DRAFT_512701 [Fomitopsis serialis]|uniref:uncharacterized protein n=1 Tax=Fomitopsis serialis TaxID=139415 RepID=UPI002007BEBD|nr:uncharacterized protein B0H18DRAFT_512701 [Neoantrodia serialis]KAH9922476.1 hypothetical protein B0H18DRAFT_512701 [Neoantrodia serialis]
MRRGLWSARGGLRAGTSAGVTRKSWRRSINWHKIGGDCGRRSDRRPPSSMKSSLKDWTGLGDHDMGDQTRFEDRGSRNKWLGFGWATLPACTSFGAIAVENNWSKYKQDHCGTFVHMYWLSTRIVATISTLVVHHE